MSLRFIPKSGKTKHDRDLQRHADHTTSKINRSTSSVFKFTPGYYKKKFSPPKSLRSTSRRVESLPLFTKRSLKQLSKIGLTYRSPHFLRTSSVPKRRLTPNKLSVRSQSLSPKRTEKSPLKRKHTRKVTFNLKHSVRPFKRVGLQDKPLVWDYQLQL